MKRIPAKRFFFFKKLFSFLILWSIKSFRLWFYDDLYQDDDVADTDDDGIAGDTDNDYDDEDQQVELDDDDGDGGGDNENREVGFGNESESDEDGDNEDREVWLGVKVETAETVKVPTHRRLVVGVGWLWQWWWWWWVHTGCHEKAVCVFCCGSGSGKLMNTILSLIKLIIVHFAHKLIFCIFLHFLSDFPHSQRLFFVANKHE